MIDEKPNSFSSLAINRLSDSDQETHPLVVESLLSTLKRLMRWFTYHGDQISAAECFIALRKAYPFLNESEYFRDPVVILLSMSSKFEDLALSCCDHYIHNVFVTPESNNARQEAIH